MTGTPYEGWFTPQERERYHEVLERRTPTSQRQAVRPMMALLHYLVKTDMTHEEMARELDCDVGSVRQALKRLGLWGTRQPTVGGPTYMAHEWYMARKDRRIWV